MRVMCRLTGWAPGRIKLQFLDRFAGVRDLGSRIDQLQAWADETDSLPLEIFGDGLYSAAVPAGARRLTIGYEMRLARAFDPAQAALTSSLGQESGVLHLADLLPRWCENSMIDCPDAAVELQLDPPAGWKVATAEGRSGDRLLIRDPSRAIVLLGALREHEVTVGTMRLRVAIAGAWSFADGELFALAATLARAQAETIGSLEQGDYLVIVAPFPWPLTGLRSSGVAVGRAAVLFLNENNDPRQSFALLRRHLPHEMLHFYLPNAFRVRENFDWFWEGVPRYLAMVALRRLGLIDFDEYLNSIADEYEAYSFIATRTQLSLLDASREKFGRQSSYDLVYRKGTLVAALLDWEIRRQSKGERSLADVLRGLYRQYALTGREVGHREVWEELNRLADLSRPIREDIEGVKEIELAARVKGYGLAVEQNRETGGRVRLRRAESWSDSQRKMWADLAR